MGNKIIFKIGFRMISKILKTKAVFIILNGIVWNDKFPQIWLAVTRENVNKRVSFKIFFILLFKSIDYYTAKAS